MNPYDQTPDIRYCNERFELYTQLIAIGVRVRLVLLEPPVPDTDKNNPADINAIKIGIVNPEDTNKCMI